MFKRFLPGKKRQTGNAAELPLVLYSVEEQGLCYSLSLADQADSWPLALYLDQLQEEEFACQLSDRWLLSWDELYRLIEDPEHRSSLGLLGLPPLTTLTPQLVSQGSLASPDFKVSISGWRDQASGAMVAVRRTGAMIEYGTQIEMLSQASWRLLGAVRHLYLAQQEAPGELTNQIGWSSIRSLALKAGAGMDGFLDKTVVVKPESLRLTPRKSMVGDTPVIELVPSFEGQPANWLSSFDGQQQVQDRYRVTDDDGSLTHVLIEPEVKSVLDYVHTLPGRRVAGDDALSFVRNPYSALGKARARFSTPPSTKRA